MARRTIRQAQDEARAVQEREELDAPTVTATATEPPRRSEADGGGFPAHVGDDTLQIDATCGAISIGEGTVRVPISLKRRDLADAADDDAHELTIADRFFCGAALHVSVRKQPVAPTTTTADLPFPGGAATPGGPHVEGEAAPRGFRVGVEKIAVSLTFPRSRINLDQLGALSEKDVRLSIRRLGHEAGDDLPEDDSDGDDIPAAGADTRDLPLD